ncbi:PiggyBac transposable element-derived protein 4, partial [Stegodyphus mimosarum]
MAQKRKLDSYDDDYDCDTESLSSFESDEDFVHSISSSEDDSSDEEDFSSVRQWCIIDSSSHAPSRFSFTGDVGMKACVTNISDPLEYFELFFTDEIINHIVTETNIFAAENLNKFKSKEHSRTHHWSETNSNELRVFFAILILQGIITKPTVRMYWSKRKLIETPSFSNIMSSRRFDLIMQFIHFDRNESTDSSHPQPKLKKIWTVLKYLQKKFSEVYTPEQDICIDESLLLYKGRLSWTQYLPLKRARFGIKMFMLCESHSGYVWSIIIYEGKGTDISEENKECSFSTQLWKKKGNKKSNLEFRIELAERIVEKYHTHRHLKSKPAETVSNTLRLSARHFPDYILPTEKKKEPTRRCVVCCSKNDANGKRIRLETRTYCKDCNAPLCAIPCFKVYHTQKDF